MLGLLAAHYFTRINAMLLFWVVSAPCPAIGGSGWVHRRHGIDRSGARGWLGSVSMAVIPVVRDSAIGPVAAAGVAAAPAWAPATAAAP